VIPVCATFFAFSDYMKPVLRVAALMETPVKFLWTHDAFRVGEDGPTHQPIEQEAQLRLLEKLNNHSGKSSLVALRPADSAETVASWKIALETKDRPTGMIFSRQNIADVPTMKGLTRLKHAMNAYRGAYLIQKGTDKPHVVLIANGSEVSTLVGAAKILESKKLKVRIVSAPSEGIFRSQRKNYQASLLPDKVPTYGLTAGLPVTLEGLVGAKGVVQGMTHFGYSAPYTVLDKKFGYTPEYVAKEVLKMLGKK